MKLIYTSLIYLFII